jgi:hypothetical protein
VFLLDPTGQIPATTYPCGRGEDGHLWPGLCVVDMSAEEWLRSMSDEELRATVMDFNERCELFDTKVRSQLNDELRRRGMETVLGYQWGSPDDAE